MSPENFTSENTFNSFPLMINRGFFSFSMVTKPSKFCCLLKGSEKLMEIYCSLALIGLMLSTLKLSFPGIVMSFSPFVMASIGFPSQETETTDCVSKR